MYKRQNLGSIEQLTVKLTEATKPEQAVTAIVSGVEVYLPLKGLVDLEKEIARLEKELASLEKEISRLNGKLSNEGFISKAPQEVVAKEKEKLVDYETKKVAVLERISSLK